MAEPAEKKAKVGEEEAKDVEMKPKEEPKKPEPPKELEEDAKKDSSPKIKDAVDFLVPDTTINVMKSSVGNIFMPLTEGGMGFLMAGVRASVGIKSGRYMFEAKIVEQMAFSDDRGGKQGAKKNVFRIGFSTAGSSLFLGEGEESVCFDDSGSYIYNKKKSGGVKSFRGDAAVSVVLNLEKDHPNCNTVSLFIGGVRACQPQALPESLQGKALFPTVSFKQTTVHLNCGPSAVAPLPFKCKMIAEAAKSDATVTTFKEPAGGKYDVLFPVGLPDEGVFDWLDMFLAKNPQYTELSDRAIVAWAEASGIWRSTIDKEKDSLDMPHASFGIPELDAYHPVKKMIHQAAALQGRHFVVMQLKGSLMKEERQLLVAKFAGNPSFKTISKVLVGEPTPDFKKKTNEKALKAKQEASDKEFQIKKKEEKRIKLLEAKKKELEKQRAKQAKIQKKKMEEAQKAKELMAKKKAKEIAKRTKELEKLKKKKEAEAKGEEYVEEPEEEEKEEEEEEKKEEPEPEEEEEEEEDAPMEEEKDEEPPKVTLTSEEKSKWFFTGSTPDLNSWTLSTNFASFTLPEKSDGFDEVTYEWTDSSSKCKSYMSSWIVKKKQVTKVEALQPSQWFHKQLSQWSLTQQLWTNKANEFKSMIAKKAADKAQKAAKKAAAERKAALEAQKKLIELKKKEEAKEEAKPEEEKEEAKEEEKEEAKEEAKPMEVEEEEEAPEEEVDFEGVDIFGVEDVCDIGGKMPLFKDFQFEDWSLMSLRFELSLLVHAFKKDVDDPERPGMPIDHVTFYFKKYFKKDLNHKFYGVDGMTELIGLVNDTLFVNKDGLLDTQLCAEMESPAAVIKLTEAARRYRKLLLDMGKEDAKLKISGMGASERSSERSDGGQKRDWQGQKKTGGWQGGKGGKGGKGWGKGGGKGWGRK